MQFSHELAVRWSAAGDHLVDPLGLGLGRDLELEPRRRFERRSTIVGDVLGLTRSSDVGKFTVKPDCAMLIMKQFGKPWMCMPCRVRTPSAHFSVSVTRRALDDLVAARRE